MDLKQTEHLLNALLRRPENSEDLVEELNDYVSDLKNGELLDSDARYIEALAKRLGVAPGSSAAPDVAGSEPDAPELEVSPLEVAAGSFLERARTTARDTLEQHRPADETDRRTALDQVSAQLDELAAGLEEEVLKDARGDGVLPVPTGHLRMTLMRDSDTPALFMHGTEKELETTPGYLKLAAKCNELALRLKIETSHEEGYSEQGDADAPALYPVEVTISGWV